MEETIHGLEYNSVRDKLIISEYGRHVQKLIKYCKTIEDKEERQRFAEAIIELMYQMYPTNKMVLEYKNRLWKHLIQIAEYDIDVTPPQGVPTSPPTEQENKIERLPYQQSEFKFRHYGLIIQKMIEKAIALDDIEKKSEYTKIIASYMKVAYRTWNKEHYVNDEIIKSDLIALSEGKLSLDDDFDIKNLGHSKKSYRQSGGRTNHRKRQNNKNHRRNNGKNYKKRR